MTIIYQQCDDIARTKIALGTIYKNDCWDGSIISFLTRLQTVCDGSDDWDLSYKLYKNVMVVKSLNNFSNAKPNDPHGFKEELVIKYDAVLAVFGKSSKGTGPMMELLKAKTASLGCTNYCAMNVTEQAIWEESDDTSTKAMLLLLNSKDDIA